MLIKPVIRWTAVLSSMLLAACHTSHSSKAIPEQGLTVSQLYHQATVNTSPVPRRVAKASVAPMVTAKQANPEFKALPNPSIDLYVFPHVMNIGGEELIKPGYTTAFYLYKTNVYALASELY